MPQPAIHKRFSRGNESMTGFSVMEESILSTLAYFDIFHYPLSAAEIAQFRTGDPSDQLLEESLQSLLLKKKIFSLGEYYSLQNNPLLEYRRKEGNARAAGLIQKAIRKGRFLQRFPFVRAVGISGSLSKNYADEKADFDFFIITAANRLWIARSFMHLFKKFAILLGRQHFYCMNYYVDEDALELTDRNIFSSIELKTLLPVSGYLHIQRLFKANPWADTWLPHCTYREPGKNDNGKPVLKRVIEFCFNNRLGNYLDNYLFQLTTRRWKKKEKLGKLNSKGEKMLLLTGKHFAKSNPGDFQEKVLDMYAQKLRALYL
jgi:hypothetical protein